MHTDYWSIFTVAALLLEVRLCRKKDLSTGNPSQFLFATGQFQKVETPTLLRLAHRLCQHLELALYGSCSWPQTL